MKVGWTTAQAHITTKANNLADARSRDDLDAFFEHASERGIDGRRLPRLFLDKTVHLELEALLDSAWVDTKNEPERQLAGSRSTGPRQVPDRSPTGP